MRITVWDPSRKNNHLSMVASDRSLSEVKPVENISKNLSFLEISPVQKEVFPSIKLCDHAYEY